MLATIIVVPTVAYVLGQTVEERSAQKSAEVLPSPPEQKRVVQNIPSDNRQPNGDAAGTITLSDRLAFDEFREEATGLAIAVTRIKQEAQHLGENTPQHLNDWIGTIEDAIAIARVSPSVEEAAHALEILSNAEKNWEEQYTLVLLVKRLPLIWNGAQELIRSQERLLTQTQKETPQDADAKQRLAILSDRIITLKAAVAKAQQLSSIGRASEALEFLEEATEVDPSGTLQKLLTVESGQIPPFDIPYFSFLPSSRSAPRNTLPAAGDLRTLFQQR